MSKSSSRSNWKSDDSGAAGAFSLELSKAPHVLLLFFESRLCELHVGDDSRVAISMRIASRDVSMKGVYRHIEDLPVREFFQSLLLNLLRVSDREVDVIVLDVESSKREQFLHREQFGVVVGVMLLLLFAGHFVLVHRAE